FLRTAVNDFMDSVHHIWCPLSSQEYQDLPDGAETTLTGIHDKEEERNIAFPLQCTRCILNNFRQILSP
ncbi:hypothetical protein, partial [Escherichia coli]|uniref:hypothetical protein n=1 Tax=Escherichia coli TaxID=562 RepID=UPI001F0CFED4